MVQQCIRAEVIVRKWTLRNSNCAIGLCCAPLAGPAGNRPACLRGHARLTQIASQCVNDVVPLLTVRRVPGGSNCVGGSEVQCPAGSHVYDVWNPSTTSTHWY